MPTSLRLPEDIETRLAGFGARTGLSKSALIVRSIQEFLARNAAPSSLQIYEEAMRDARNQRSDAKTDVVLTAFDDASEQALQLRPAKLAARQALGKKHATRSERATKALASKRGGSAKSP